MDPIIRTHTKEDMSAMKEGKQEDTMCKETNCNSIYHNTYQYDYELYTPLSVPVGSSTVAV